VRRIGVLANEDWPPLEGLRQGLRELGYIEGKNIRIEYRFAAGHAEQFPVLAAELVALPVDLIVSQGTPASLAARKATSSIPIVMSAGDPVAAGVVGSLSQPGGNVTRGVDPGHRNGSKTGGAAQRAAADSCWGNAFPLCTPTVSMSTRVV